MIKNIFCSIIILSSIVFSQNNTLQLSENQKSPSAKLKVIEWLAGHWRGEAFGGITEEVWSSPLGNSMMGSFKLVIDGKVEFYELETIQEIDSTLILRLKHFHSDLKGWEEKDQTVDFKLVKVESTEIYFEGFTIIKITNDEINMYVVISNKDDKIEEVKFNFKRYIIN
jgi:hypothetical protein